MDCQQVLTDVRRLAERFAAERRERQARRKLDPADFEALRAAGYLLTAVPTEQGGLWQDQRRSVRAVSEILRTLAHGDSSVALVASMHPAVLAFWLTTPQVAAPQAEAWAAQRRAVCGAAADGAWWGTITSEPGSGGDVSQTRTVAARNGSGSYRLTGQKHFGSGSGIASYMVTTAVPEGESEPDWFYVDLRGVSWDGSAGLTLTAPWDGHGMTATQSHALRFDGFPATRLAWPGHLNEVASAAFGFIECLFAAVVVGVLETAVATAREQLAGRKEQLRPYERVEWSRAEMESWLAQQAYEGMLRAVETTEGTPHPVVQGKMAISELAEQATTRLCRVMGGGSFSRHSPFGHWAQDVRALGFLRPPWGLAYDRLYDGSWSA
jgi:alkylation response protein AidB-like acyl-CoA dehydrogenase